MGDPYFGGGGDDGYGGGGGGFSFGFNFGMPCSDFVPCGLPLPGLGESIWSDLLGLPSGLNCPQVGGLSDFLCGGVSPIMDAQATMKAGSLDILNDYCSARGRAKFIADWFPGGGTIARDLWGSYFGDKLGFYQLSVADLDRITEENHGSETVAMHAASEAAKAAAASSSFLYTLRANTGIPMSFASKWLGRASVGLLLFDAGKGFYNEGVEILNCQAGN